MAKTAEQSKPNPQPKQEKTHMNTELLHNLETLSAAFRDLAVCNHGYQYELHQIADSIYTLRNNIKGQQVENHMLSTHPNAI